MRAAHADVDDELPLNPLRRVITDRIEADIALRHALGGDPGQEAGGCA